MPLDSLGGGRQVDSSATTALAFGGFNYSSGPYGTAQTNKYCSVSFNRSAFNFDSTNNTVATGSFLGSLKGTLDGTATYAYEANSAISATTATSASYAVRAISSGLIVSPARLATSITTPTVNAEELERPAARGISPEIVKFAP